MPDTSATVENRKRITGFSTFRAVPMQKYINSNHGKRRSLLKAFYQYRPTKVILSLIFSAAQALR